MFIVNMQGVRAFLFFTAGRIAQPAYRPLLARRLILHGYTGGRILFQQHPGARAWAQVTYTTLH